jgi:hypothetical protein
VEVPGHSILELRGLTWGCLYFILLVGESQGVNICFQIKLLLTAVQSHRLQLFHGLLYIWYAATQFPSFLDANKDVFLTWIQDIARGVVSAVALEYCVDCLVEQPQEWGDGDGQILNLGIQIGKPLCRCRRALLRRGGASLLDDSWTSGIDFKSSSSGLAYFLPTHLRLTNISVSQLSAVLLEGLSISSGMVHWWLMQVNTALALNAYCIFIIVDKMCPQFIYTMTRISNAHSCLQLDRSFHLLKQTYHQHMHKTLHMYLNRRYIWEWYTQESIPYFRISM